MIDNPSDTTGQVSGLPANILTAGLLRVREHSQKMTAAEGGQPNCAPLDFRSHAQQYCWRFPDHIARVGHPVTGEVWTQCRSHATSVLHTRAHTTGAGRRPPRSRLCCVPARKHLRVVHHYAILLPYSGEARGFVAKTVWGLSIECPTAATEPRRNDLPGWEQSTSTKTLVGHAASFAHTR